MAAKKAKTEGKELKFEDALKRLEAIVSELEGEDVPLERALELFQEGVELGRRCGAKLDEAEHKVSVLLERADGTVEEKPFEAESDGAGGAPAKDDAADDTERTDDGIPF